MSPLWKSVARELVARSRLPRLRHRALHRSALTIVMYHGIVDSPPEVEDWCFVDAVSFRRQADYLARHFAVLSLSQAAERLAAGEIDGPTAVITFDDGFQSQHDLAWSVLRERNLPATLFLATGLVGTADTVWYGRLDRALAETAMSRLEWHGEPFELATAAGKAAAARILQARLKALPHPRLLRELRELLFALGDDPERPVGAGSPYRVLSREAVAEMAASGSVEFGAHTHSHAILARLPPEEADAEIQRSLEAVQALTGLPCQLFSYPNGRPEDYDRRTILALQARGVRAAVTTEPGPNHPDTPPLELRRYGVGRSITMPEFELMVHHWSHAARPASPRPLR